MCLGFVALGLLLPLAFPSAPFAPYRDAVSRAIGDPHTLDLDAARLVSGITGASIAGKWTLHWALVRFGVRERYRWAWRATLAGLNTWFVVDSTSSLLGGAWANVVMINGLPLALVLPLAWRLRESCTRDPEVAQPAERSVSRAAIASGVLGVGSGIAIAFAIDTPIFDAWWQGLSSAQFGGGAVPSSVHALVRYFAGPIGGSTAGQCVMLCFVARYAIAARSGWAWRWSAISVLVWALADSAWSVSARGAFNVALVNLPAASLLLAPLAWAGARQRAARA